MYRISIFSSDPPLLYKYTVSAGEKKITAAPLMHQYWDYCHLCLHIFPLINVTQTLCLPNEKPVHLHDFLYMVQIWG